MKFGFSRTVQVESKVDADIRYEVTRMSVAELADFRLSVAPEAAKIEADRVTLTTSKDSAEQLAAYVRYLYGRLSVIAPALIRRVVKVSATGEPVDADTFLGEATEELITEAFGLAEEVQTMTPEQLGNWPRRSTSSTPGTPRPSSFSVDGASQAETL